MRPRSSRATPPLAARAAAELSSQITGRVPLLNGEALVTTAQPHTGDKDAEEEEEDALALFRDRQRPLPRRLSKNCTTIKRFGPRLTVRRRQRLAERVVLEDVERLKQTLDAMDRRMSLLDSITLSMRQNAESAAVDMVRTYFHHMKHGLNPAAVAYDRDVTTPFLEAMMSPDLKCQDFSGLRHFFTQWEYVTKYHAAIEMENTQLVPLPVENDSFGNDVIILKATGLTHCRISRDTLVHFFPHIMPNEALLQWLIGKQYSYGYTMVLHVNSTGRVFQFESRIDLTSGLLSLISDPQITLQLLESSMWTKAGNLRGEVQEQQVPIENSVLA